MSTLIKCKGARERRSKEACILQRKNCLNLIPKNVCIYKLTKGFECLLSLKPVNEHLPLCVSTLSLGEASKSLARLFLTCFVMLFLLLETALLLNEEIKEI